MDGALLLLAQRGGAAHVIGDPSGKAKLVRAALSFNRRREQKRVGRGKLVVEIALVKDDDLLARIGGFLGKLQGNFGGAIGKVAVPCAGQHGKFCVVHRVGKFEIARPVCLVGVEHIGALGPERRFLVAEEGDEHRAVHLVYGGGEFRIGKKSQTHENSG